MNNIEAKELIKKYISENFDDRWHPDPIYIEEFPDFFEFDIDSKKYVESKDFRYSFVGLGSSYLSKKYGEIVQYGSAPGPSIERRDFLKTEHKLDVIRKKYKIERADYFYNITIQNITDEEKASKYIDKIQIYSGGPTFKEMLNLGKLKLNSINYFDLLNLLYFNIVNPFCKIFYEKKILKGHDDTNLLRKYESFNRFDSEDILFQNYMLDKVKKQYPSMGIDKCYSSKIIGIYDENRLFQYLPIAGFRYYGEDFQTGFIGFVLGYSDDEVKKMILKNNVRLDFVDGKDILFFLFMNVIKPFCEIEIEVIADN